MNLYFDLILMISQFIVYLSPFVFIARNLTVGLRFVSR